MRMPINTVSPIHIRERVMGTPFRILHRQERRKVVFFRVTRVEIQARKLELLPILLIFDDHQGVLSVQREELRSDPESLERDFGEHDVVAARVVPVEQVRVVRDYLDEALVVRENQEWLFGPSVPVEGVVEEEVVDVVEGVDWDTMLRDECEVKVQRVVEEGLRDEPTRGGDERGRRA